jgi:hypothetical protein
MDAGDTYVPNLWFLHLSDFFILSGNKTAKFSVTDYKFFCHKGCSIRKIKVAQQISQLGG